MHLINKAPTLSAHRSIVWHCKCNGSVSRHQSAPWAAAALPTIIDAANAWDIATLSVADNRQTSTAVPQGREERSWCNDTFVRHPDIDTPRIISKKLVKATSPEALLRIIVQHAPAFSEANTAQALAKLTRLLRFQTADVRVTTKTSPGFNLLSDLVSQQAHAFNPTQLATVITSYAFLNHAPAGPVLAHLAACVQRSLDDSDPDDICHMLWALTKLGYPAADLLQAASQHSLDKHWIHQLTAKPLTSFLWVHATLEQRGHSVTALPPFVAAVFENLSAPGFLATFTPQELSQLLWSLASLNITAVPPLVLNTTCQLAVEQVVRFTPQGITNTCWALSKLLQACQQQAPAPASSRVPADVLQLFQTFGDSAAAQLEYYRPQEVANLLGAYARIGLSHAALLAATDRYVRLRSHMFNAKDVSEMLAAYVGLQHQPDPSALQPLVHRTNQLAHSMPCYQLVTAAWGVVRLGQSPEVLLSAAAAAIAVANSSAAGSSSYIVAFSTSELSKLLWTCAACNFVSGPLLQAVEQQIGSMLEDCSSHDLIVALHAFAKLQHTCSRELLQAAGKRLLLLQPYIAVDKLVVGMWSVVKLQQRLDAGTGVRHSQASVPEAEMLDADDVRADMGMGDTDIDLISQHGVDGGTVGSQQTHSRSSSSSCSSPRRAMVSGTGVAAALVYSTVQHLCSTAGLQQLTAQGVALVLWCMAVANPCDSDMLPLVIQAVSTRLRQMSARGLSMVVMAVAKLQQQLGQPTQQQQQQQQQQPLQHCTHQQLPLLVDKLVDMVIDRVDALLGTAGSSLRPPSKRSRGSSTVSAAANITSSVVTGSELATLMTGFAQLEVQSPQLLAAAIAAVEVLLQQGGMLVTEAVQVLCALAQLHPNCPAHIIDELVEIMVQHHCSGASGPNIRPQHANETSSQHMTGPQTRNNSSSRSNASSSSRQQRHSTRSHDISSNCPMQLHQAGLHIGLSPRQLVRALTAFAQLGYQPPKSLLAVMCDQLLPHLPHLHHTSLAQLLQALAVLQMKYRPLVLAVAEELLQRITQQHPVIPSDASPHWSANRQDSPVHSGSSSSGWSSSSSTKDWLGSNASASSSQHSNSLPSQQHAATIDSSQQQQHQATASGDAAADDRQSTDNNEPIQSSTHGRYLGTAVCVRVLWSLCMLNHLPQPLTSAVAAVAFSAMRQHLHKDASLLGMLLECKMVLQRHHKNSMWRPLTHKWLQLQRNLTDSDSTYGEHPW
eukprot:jgi/Chrzof1/1255/Cz01g46150.t1